MGTFYHLAFALAIATTIVLAAPQEHGKEYENEIMVEESRGKLRKAIMPFLIGLVLKASTLIPLKLMAMTFVVLLTILTSKLAVALAAIVGLHQYYKGHTSHSHDLSGSYSSPQLYSISAPSSHIGMSESDQLFSGQNAPQPYIRRVHHIRG